MHVNDLPRDVFAYIFQYITFRERVRCEQICKHWRLQLFYSFSKIKKLNVAEFLRFGSRDYYQQDTITFEPTVVGLVSRCGPYVKEISFGCRWLKITQPIIDTISEYSTQLKKLDLGCTILSANILQALDQLANQLQEFSLEETIWVDREDAENLDTLFVKMQNLHKLNLRRALFSLNTLPQLPESLIEINLNGAKAMEPYILHQFLTTHHNLEVLHLGSNNRIDQMTIDIVSNLVKLRVLEMSYMNKQDLELQALGSLTRMEELHLHYNFSLNDISFTALCHQLCNLRLLNVTSCKCLFDYGQLQHCKKLNKLVAGNTVQICDDDLTALALNGELQSLTLVKCYNVTTDGIIGVANRCPLKEINVAQCPSVTDGALISLAASPEPKSVISLQGCNISDQGVTALTQLDNLLALKEVDISYNRSVSDKSIMALHQAIWENQKTPMRPEDRMILYVHQTQVKKATISKVADCINLIL